VDRIDFFKDKESEFLFLIMPELKPLKLLEGDVLYQQRDYADEVYLIKEGTIKLNIDISDFILEGDPEIYMTQHQKEDEEDEEDQRKNIFDLCFPFIKYIEGSYFGDVDILVPGLKFFERDSTAVAASEVNLFVLSRDIIMNVLKRTYAKEIKQMEQLAKRRKACHKVLMDRLAKKVRTIQSQKKKQSIGSRDFYEANLINMEANEVGLAEPKSDSENESAKTLFSNRKLNRKDLGSARKLSPFRDSGKITPRNRSGRRPIKNSAVDEKRDNLRQRQELFEFNYQDTLANFKFNMQVLDEQSAKMAKLSQSLQQQQS